MARSGSPSVAIGSGAVLGFGVALAVVLAWAMAWGLPYYRLGEEVRALHPLHPVLEPAGPAGVGYGVAGAALLVAMLGYSVRKRLLGWTWLGDLGTWLRFHIVCGVAGPLFVLLHCAAHVPRGIAAVAYWCMVIVALSGVFGRYVYGWFPRMEDGRAMARDEAADRLTELRAQLVEATAAERGAHVGHAVALVRDLDLEARSVSDLVRLRWDLWRRARRVRGVLARSGLPPARRRRAWRLLAGQLRIEAGLASMRVAARVLRYWHLFHRPLASAMYLAVLLHVIGEVVYGHGVRRVLGLPG